MLLIETFSPLLYGESIETSTVTATTVTAAESFSPLLYGESIETSQKPYSGINLLILLSVPFSTGNRLKPSDQGDLLVVVEDFQSPSLRGID